MFTKLLLAASVFALAGTASAQCTPTWCGKTQTDAVATTKGKKADPAAAKAQKADAGKVVARKG